VQLTLSPTTSVATLALIGGGEFSFGETREIDALLLARMPADRRRVAFLPTASGSAEYGAHFGTYLRTIDETVEVVNVPVYRGRDNRRQRNLDTILSAGMIYLGGGVTNAFLETIRESAAELALRDAAANGAVIAAIGAAASCFGASTRNMRSGAPLPGLGWLAHTAVETAFDPENDAPLRRLMSLPDIHLGLGIPAGTALVIASDGVADIVGDGKVAAFRKASGN
jgi:cyanophycinase-like exopeptidase